MPEDNSNPVPANPSLPNPISVFNLKDDWNTMKKYVNAKPNPAALAKAPVIIDQGKYKSLADMQATGYLKDKKVAEFAAARQVKDPNSKVLQQPIYVTQSLNSKPVTGLKKSGNLDLGDRPNIDNGDGTHSSTFSMSFGTDEGEVLVPGVGDGKSYPLRKLTTQEALDQYKKTGKNFGTFASPKDADAYGKALHEDQAKYGSQPKTPMTPMLRIQAVTGKIQRILATPQYALLRPENRAKVMGEVYDRYVVSALKNAGIEPPSKEEWLAGQNVIQGTEGKPKEDRAMEGSGELIKGYADTVRLGGNLIKYSIGNGVLPGEKAGTRDSTLSKFIDRNTQKIFDYADTVSKVATDYDSTFQRRHDPESWLANFAGRVIGDAPAYMAASEVGAGIKIAEAIPALAEKGAMSAGLKVGVSALKNAAEVIGVIKGEGHSNKEALQGGAFTLALGGALHGVALKFGAAKLAVGGEPFAEKVAESATEADKAEGINTTNLEHGPKALVAPNDPIFKQSVKAEQQLRGHFARDFHPEKAEASGDKSVWRNLSKGQRAKILDHISSTNKQAAELMPLVNPEIQTMANTKTIVEGIGNNPQQAARMQAIQKLTGLNPAEVLTKLQAKAVGQDTGLVSPARNLEEGFSEGGMYGESRVKGARTVSNASLINPNLSTKDFIEGTRKYLEPNSGSKSVAGRENFENPEHHLLWVANFSDAPQPVKNRAFNILRKDFNLSRAQAGDTAKGGWLANFREDLARTGHLDTEGNIFRSTKNTQRRYATSYQKEVLEDESMAADMRAVSKIIRKHPEMKSTFEALNETLTQLKNKSATPITEKLRRTTQDRLVELMQRYK